ncbi:MAG: hypothetical protein AB7G05_05030 [Hyphomonadaceae bacterium]
MRASPGFLTYAIAAVGGLAAATSITGAISLRGHYDLAISLGVMFAVLYAVTPAAHRRDVKRIWGAALLAFAAMLFSSAAAMLLGVPIGAGALSLTQVSAAPAVQAAAAMTAAGVIALLVYLAAFRVGWRLVRPRGLTQTA